MAHSRREPTIGERHRRSSVTFHDTMEVVVRGFEAAGVFVLVAGSIGALVMATRRWLSGERTGEYQRVRRSVGRAIILGLEILIIADIVQTITIDPTLESAVALGIIVLVRTFLSFSLEIELDGSLPWRRAATSTEP
jgi:uncharacterized membrane protein